MQIEAELGSIPQIEAELGPARITVTEGEDYTGDYTVIPALEQQSLKTKNKVMRDDVTVKAIPLYRVSNSAGGMTISIGKLEE